MSLSKWASRAAENIRSIREVSPDEPTADNIGGIPEQSQPDARGEIPDEDWFEDPASDEPAGIPENGRNSNRTDPDDPTGTDRSFTKLNGSEVTGSGGGRQLEPRNSYHGG